MKHRHGCLSLSLPALFFFLFILEPGGFHCGVVWACWLCVVEGFPSLCSSGRQTVTDPAMPAHHPTSKKGEPAEGVFRLQASALREAVLNPSSTSASFGRRRSCCDRTVDPAYQCRQGLQYYLWCLHSQRSTRPGPRIVRPSPVLQRLCGRRPRALRAAEDRPRPYVLRQLGQSLARQQSDKRRRILHGVSATKPATP